MTLTPYDTGDRLQPMPWHVQPRNLPDPEEVDRYGKVDFDNDESTTVATLWIERGEDGAYTLKGHTNEPVKIEIQQEEPVYHHDREYLSPDHLYDVRFGDSGEYPGDDSRD